MGVSNKLVIFIALICLSCGANYHLKKANKHLRIAQMKGAKIVPDTIYKTVPIVTDRFVHDTVVSRVNTLDTLIINHTRYRVKLKYDTVTLTEFVEVECKPDTIYREVPVQVPITIKPNQGFQWWWIVAVLVVVAIAVGLIKKRIE